jgi:glycine C-acetyltransferase
MGRVDLITTTFGKALGGASGGCTAGRAEIVNLLRQRSRPYLFSNSLPPAVVGATLKAIELIRETEGVGSQLRSRSRYFRSRLAEAGFDVLPGETAIVPVMLYNEPLAVQMADALLDEGVYVIGFSFPVVPKGQARIRVQLSAAHEQSDLDEAVSAFTRVGSKLGVLHP